MFTAGDDLFVCFCLLSSLWNLLFILETFLHFVYVRVHNLSHTVHLRIQFYVRISSIQ